MKQHFILATAGHVDHGKSSLVKALTGIDPDRLPEEKARGITIELGFAHLELVDEQKPGSEFRLGIVDVPGHEDFVKNMVAGVGSVDLALLVVAADDGWMPQTEEHFQILTYLGVKRLVVALTKVDLPDIDPVAASSFVRQQLADTCFGQAPIVPVSAISGTGLADLKSALVSVLSEMLPPRDIGKPRLPIDRVFTLHGIGTVVTGTLTGGTLTTGQVVTIQPAGNTARIRSIQSHNQAAFPVGPGMRVGLNLTDLLVNTKHTANPAKAITRGETITLAELGQPTSTLEVLLTRSPRLGQHKTPAQALKDGARVRIHYGSGDSVARINLQSGKEIPPGGSAIAQLCFETPVFAFVNDRFIVRDWPEQTTLAGGVILETNASRKNFREPGRRLFLQTCAESSAAPEARVKAQLQCYGLVRAAELLVQSNYSAAEISVAASEAERNGQVLKAAGFIADVTWWTKLRHQAIELIEAAHRQHPDRAGLALSELRGTLATTLPFSEVFEALLTDLYRSGFVQAGTAIKRASHVPALPVALQAAGSRLRTALTLKPLEPPSRLELAPTANDKQALHFLIQTGQAVELGPDIVLSKEAFSEATGMIRKFLTSRPSATVSELRQAVGTSRRVMVPLLEKLDHLGITQRQGDQRVLRRS
jgi:selenocysteine-specific elongation factor